MSKILILANDYKTIANFRMEILQALQDAGHTVCISIPADERNKAFTDLGCRVRPTDITRHGTNPLKELQLKKEYVALLKEEQPDIVLTYTVKPNIYGSMACRKLKIPVINNVTGMGSILQKGGVAAKLLFALQKAGLKKSDCVFFQNAENLRQYREKNIVGANADLLPGSGVNLDKHCFVPYPTEANGIHFVIVSRLRKDKGYDEFFSMVDHIRAEHSDVYFHIVGWTEEDSYKAVLETYADCPNVINHGEVTQQQVHDIVAQCHCIVHPSYHEGMANVLMEAAAAGRPCLASDISGCKELIDDGKSGFTFASQDAEALTAAVRKFLALSEQEHTAMGVAGRTKMENEFDRKIVAGKYLEKIAKLTTTDKESEQYVTV